ncbi:MAG: hypothetical protein ACM31C_06365, partial [Acidobacteriota bacterium]
PEDPPTTPVGRAHRARTRQGRRPPEVSSGSRREHARPIVHDGVVQQTTDYLVRAAIGRFRAIWPDREAVERAFEAELPELARDPHLAIYWLLHATALVEDERRARVVDALGDGGCELVRAFVARLAALPVAGDLPVVPEFRARRALALAYGAFSPAPEEVPGNCLRSLEVSPATNSLAHGLQVAMALEKGTMHPGGVALVLDRIPDVTPGTELVRAVLAKRAGQMASPHADALARQLATDDEPWWFALEALWLVHELAYDGRALAVATRRIVAHDRYHRRALQMQMRAAQIAGDPVDAIEVDLAIADSVMAQFGRLVEHPDELAAVVAALAGLAMLRRGLAWRVLQRARINAPAAPVFAWAAGEVLAQDGVAAAPLVAGAFAQLAMPAQAAAVVEVAASIDRADHRQVDVLLACLEAPEPPAAEHAARFALDQARGAIVGALARHAHEPALFDRLLAIVERRGTARAVAAIWDKLFSPFAETTYVVPRLDPAQAVRAARALIATQLHHPDLHARNAAGHQLYRFSHAGAQDFLIDALTEYAVRFAADKQAGERLEDVVANLYAAVRGLDTPASREALIERLFAERRAYWRMANAIGEIWSPEVHARVLALLAERRDARAAGCYAYALADFVRQTPPLADLARLVCEWQGDTELARGFLHYALAVGEKAALDLGDLDLVRRAHEAAAWIAEPPLEPDDHARGRGWQNPLDEPAVAARIQRIVAGLPEQPEQRSPTRQPRKAKAARAAQPGARPKANAAKPKAKAAKPKAKAAKAKAAKAKAKARPKVKPKPNSKARPKGKPKKAPKSGR